ncbi:MAG: large conductance mechanosensitive channel protein MscL [Ruminococcaceae bacterium]|nr:large conductance mechanosensitive channel protein MscL [Oscillospiraceae bacterium]
MKKFFAEFKEFAIKGNAFDMAIGVVIAQAFKAIVDSLVADVIMPIISLLLKGYDFASLAIKFGSGEEAASLNYGLLIQNIVNFLLTALSLFMVVKAINTFKKRKEVVEEAQEEAEPEKSDEVVLLEQIKDALVDLKNK